MAKNLRIETDGVETRVFVDGAELHGVFSIEFTHLLNEAATIKIGSYVHTLDAPPPAPRGDG